MSQQRSICAPNGRAQNAHHIERFARQIDNTWVFSEVTDPTVAIELATIQCTLPLAEVYERVDFSQDEATE